MESCNRRELAVIKTYLILAKNQCSFCKRHASPIYSRLRCFLKQVDKIQVMSPLGAPQLVLQSRSSKTSKKAMVAQHNREDCYLRNPSEHRKQRLRERIISFSITIGLQAEFQRKMSQYMTYMGHI